MTVLEQSAPVVSTQLGSPSRLDLEFTCKAGSTRMTIATQDAPWRAIRAFQNSQGQAVVHLHNVSGGILSGDSLELAITARTSTRVQITSVGATRIYRHRPGRPTARLSTSLRVEDDAVLEFLPDAIIPFAGSRFHQSTIVSLGRNAGFIGWETLAAGRVASGEEFAFDNYRSECRVQSEARPLATERYSLTPAKQEFRSVARWGRFRYTATLYICHTGIEPARWLALETKVNDLAFEQTSPVARWGASTLIAGGLVVRGLALEAHQITEGLHTFWDQAKQELWGQPAIPPRKIN